MSQGTHDSATRCARLIDTLNIPDPFDTKVFLDLLARKRGKRIRLLSGHLGADQLCGLLVSTSEVDYIVYADNLPPFQSRHAVVHEVGHLLCDHPTSPRGGGRRGGVGDDVMRLLLPTLSPSLIQRILGRTTSASGHEREAELFASMLLSQVGTTDGSPSGQVLGCGADRGRGSFRQPGISALWTSSRLWSLFRHLTSVWTQLTAQVPEVVLGDLNDWPLTSTGLARYRLYRRVLEIRDAQLTLRPFIPPRVREWALAGAAERSLDPLATAIVLEASELGSAVDARHAGRRRRPRAVTGATLQVSPATPGLLTEADWLIRVASSLSCDPVVAAVRHRATVAAMRGAPGHSSRSR